MWQGVEGGFDTSSKEASTPPRRRLRLPLEGGFKTPLKKAGDGSSDHFLLAKRISGIQSAAG
jgi:hypothetical protein